MDIASRHQGQMRSSAEMKPQRPARTASGVRRLAVRVPADFGVVVVRASGMKQPARLVDVSTAGMQLEAAEIPGYGENVTVVVRLGECRDWLLLPAQVRWFSRGGFGVELTSLDAAAELELGGFVAGSAP
jgi:hypothetical protein